MIHVNKVIIQTEGHPSSPTICFLETATSLNACKKSILECRIPKFLDTENNKVGFNIEKNYF